MKEPGGKNRENDVLSPHILRRATALAWIAGGLFLFLLIRILLFQTAGYGKYQQKVIEQMTTEAQVSATRGNITDRNGILLATNVTTYRVFISPSSIASEQTERNQSGDGVRLDDLISRNLSDILGVQYDFVMKQCANTRYLDRTILKEVDEERADRVRAFIAEYGLQRMIYLQTTHTRYYPYSTRASHVLGFTGSDGTGLYGLEYQYNDALSGTNGRYITARDAQGNEMPYEYKEYIEAEDGYNINTTLDVYVQSALEEQLKNAYVESAGKNRAAGIVMDVNTGAVLGMAVCPEFDLNNPRTLDEQSQTRLDQTGLAVGSDDYNAVKQQYLLSMWSNKAITESYIPGSTFKIITASMALEEGVVEDINRKAYDCPGYKVVSGHKIHCHKTTGHGSLTFAEGIQQSCNPVLMSVGLAIGKPVFYNYLRSYGYFEKTGIDLPGEGNGVFAEEEKFIDLDLAIYSFGQNFNVTLIQQITAVSAVANGGYLVTPHMVSSITDRNGNVIRSFDDNVRRQVVSAATCKTVAGILEEGVSGNGGAKNAYVAGYRIAAKTGTSEKKNAGSVGRYVCSTVAFAPADRPQYAVIIIVDEPTQGLLYGSTVAAPYVGKVMETILPYLGVEAVYTDEELAKTTVTVPRVTAWSLEQAKKLCEGRSYGFKVEVVGDGTLVYKQVPEAGTVVERGSGKIVLYTDRAIDGEDVRVPNLVGLSAAAANQALINAGLNVRITGTKNYTGTGVKVTEQSIPGGTMVPKGTVVEIRLLALEDRD